MTQQNQLAERRTVSLTEKFANKFGVEPEKMMTTLKATAFRQRNGSSPTNEQMMALLVVADQYGLNPWTKEIYAFPDKQNGIIPVVGVDGWSRIINTTDSLDGMEFRYSDQTIDTLPGQKHAAPEWCECVIYRKDRSHPITVREYLDEAYRAPFKQGMTGPWQTHTRRLLRHKSMIQAARIAFGFVGIYDQDEAERIIEGEVIERGTPDELEGKSQEEKVINPAPVPAPPDYPGEQFDTNFPTWKTVIESGKKTPEQVINTVGSRYTLSEEQKQQINNVGGGR